MRCFSHVADCELKFTSFTSLHIASSDLVNKIIKTLIMNLRTDALYEGERPYVKVEQDQLDRFLQILIDYPTL